MTLVLHEATWPLSAAPQSVGDARDHARAFLGQWGLNDLADDVLLVISELVTNAVVHAAPPILLSLHLYGQALRGEVSDHCCTKPLPLTVDFDQERGRGLAIVSAYTYRWGVDPLPDGKSVWCLWRVSS